MSAGKSKLTAKALLSSGLVGLWKERKDMTNKCCRYCRDYDASSWLFIDRDRYGMCVPCSETIVSEIIAGCVTAVEVVRYLTRREQFDCMFMYEYLMGPGSGSAFGSTTRRAEERT